MFFGTVTDSPSERCKYYIPENRTWSSKGCFVAGINGATGKILCNCFHLTEFSGVSGKGKPSPQVVDPVGGASNFTGISPLQIIFISCIAGVFAIYVLAVVVGKRKDALEQQAFAKSPIEFLRKSVGTTKSKSKMRVIMDKFWEQMNQKHMLYQLIAGKPYYSLTRPQVATCFLCYLSASLTANAIFYGKASGDPGQKLLTGILTGLITFPTTYAHISLPFLTLQILVCEDVC